jgi:hypothetical protein
MAILLYYIATGFAGAYIAKKRKLNPFFWFSVCFMLGLIGLISFLCLPYFLKKQKKILPTTPVTIPPPPAFPLDSIWYYLDQKEETIGPMSFARLLEIKHDGIINENHYIWNEDFDEWRMWGSVFPRDKPEK